MAPEAMLACVENAPMHAYCSPTESGVLLSAINPTDDPVDQVVWNIAPGSFVNGNWRCLERNGHWRAIEPVRKRSGGSSETLTFDAPVAPLSGGFFEYRPFLT